MISKPTKILTEDRATNQAFDQVNSSIGQIVDMEIMQGQLLQGIPLTNANDNFINHKLGRKLIGWFITRKRDAATIYDKQDANKLQDKTLILTSNLSTTVDIYVF